MVTNNITGDATVFFFGLSILTDPFLSFLVASGVVASRGRHQAKLPDGEKIWAQQTLNNDAVLDLEEGGLHEPLHNTQQKLLKQGGDNQPTNGRETSAPKGMCGSNYSVHNYQKG